MNEIAEKILKNKPDYLRNLKFLDSKYNGVFTRKLAKEKNNINVLSIFSEMNFGYILNQVFSEVIYEPNIFGKTPDWLVTSNNQNIIFEVKNINPLEKEMADRIDLFKEDKYFGSSQTSYRTSINDFIPQISKITKKEEVYRDLIIKHNYKLIVCVDLVALQKNFITDNDSKDYLDFENKNSILNHYADFCNNVSGIIVNPILGDITFIENKSTKHKLNINNINRINSLVKL